MTSHNLIRRVRIAAFLGSLSAIVASAIVALIAVAAPPTTRPVEGLRDNTPQIYALTNARIVVAPGEVIEKGTVVVRGDVIEAVGADVALPADARTLDLTGRTIYPGLIDAYSEVGIGDDDARSGAPSWNPNVLPQRRVAARYQANAGLNEKLRSQGITLRLAVPAGGIIKGTSSLVTTGDQSNDQALVKNDVAQHLRLTVSRGSRDQYPNSPMGAVALARQTFYDAQWYRDAWRTWKANSNVPRPETNDALAALQDLADEGGLVVFDGINELYALRADQFAREFSLNAVIRGSGREYRRLEAIQQLGRPILVPVNFPKPPNVATPEAVRSASLDALMHWELAPENPARLRDAGVTIALCSHGLDDVSGFLKSVRRAVQRGLSAEDALRAVTSTPAELFGMADRVGSVRRGRLANLIVVDGDLFEEKTKVQETWVLGQRFLLTTDPLFDLRGEWPLILSPKPKAAGDWVVTLTGKPTSLEGTIAARTPKKDDEPIKLKHVGLRDSRFGASFDAKRLGYDGVAQLSVVVEASPQSELHWLGQIVWPDGSSSSCTATRKPQPDAEANRDSNDKEKADEASDKKKAESATPTSVNFPLGAFGVERPVDQPRHVLFTNATVWTSGPDGIQENVSLLVSDGKVAAIGADIAVPDGTTVVDAVGRHITPGIIDCHSHMATDGGINEGTQANTAEVRIGDFIDANDINIYRQLAGGVTTANVLHGSANPIGGQNQVIKLRWGLLPEELKFTEAPAGIKFALGENVKQSNWGERYSSRYPQTRMGVEQIMRDAFEAAKLYELSWRQWQDRRQGLPPRRDLEHDAIAEILRGERWIHCHSYRQDEILALLRTLEEYQVTVGTLQHILEGYKVADAMAQHGAMGSSFSDWWAYKFEVFDAIPYNGALMHNAGVVVSFNSDDAEMARHLNHEAAKAVKYGDVTEEEALKFVTLNPAKQLRIEQYVGSLEPGKHADLVVWSGPPLSNFSRCEQTWVDGRKYFDREEDVQLRARDRQLRARLVQKILGSGDEMLAPGQRPSSEEELWPREDIYCHARDHGHGR